jgi:hypothetical protein
MFLFYFYPIFKPFQDSDDLMASLSCLAVPGKDGGEEFYPPAEVPIILESAITEVTTLPVPGESEVQYAVAETKLPFQICGNFSLSGEKIT